MGVPVASLETFWYRRKMCESLGLFFDNLEVVLLQSKFICKRKNAMYLSVLTLFLRIFFLHKGVCDY